MRPMEVGVGITGASGVIYGARLLEILSRLDTVRTHLMISEVAEKLLLVETKYDLEHLKRLADYHYEIDDFEAPVASGSFRLDAMVVAPCSMKTMSALAYSHADNLIARAGDVLLKEKRTLVLLVREAPLHLGHLRGMTHLAEMGAIVFPPVPSFYLRPSGIDDLVTQTLGRVLDLLHIEHNLCARWPMERE